MRSFTRVFLMVLLCMIGLHTAQAKTEKVYATFENPSNTNTTWNAETKTFTWSTTYYNQLRNIGLPTGDITKYKKLVVDCEIKSGDQFRILFYKGGSNKTLYASNGVNEFILADTLKALYPDDFNEFLLQCDEICLSGNNAVAPGEAVINAVYLETYDDEGEKVYATFENPSNTNTTWNAETKTFTWSTTYYNQLRNIGLPNGDITKYKKLVVDCEIKSGDQFRVLFYKGGSNKTLYASNGVNEFILADTLKALYPDDYNEFLLQCDEICLSGNNAVAPGEAVINAVYLETYPENESVEIPDITYEEDPGKPAGEFVDFTEAFPALQPRIGLGTDGHPIVLGNGEVVVGQRTKDVIADLSDYSKLTIVTSPNLKLVVYMNHEVDAQQNAGDYSEGDAGKYVFLDIQANENGIAEMYDKQDLNCICLPWDNNNKGTVWYLLLTAKPAADDVLPIDIQFGADYNDASVGAYDKTWTATKDGKTWTLVNFNNNNNAWTSVKCGRKNVESVASITSPAINAEVTNYVVSLTKASNVNSATLTIMNGEEKVGEAIDITENFVAGEVNVPVEGQKGYSYILTINNASASGNGSVEISKITLYGEGQYVEPVHIANTAETAYTVAEAVALIEAGEALSETVFVKGIVSTVESFNDTYKSITYWISADGKTEGQQFECYSGKGINGADFASIEDIEVGAEVIVKGTMKKYIPDEGDPIYEFNYNNELVTYKAPFHAPIAEGKYYIFNPAANGYIVGANNWGTRASISQTGGIEFEAVLADGKYELKSAPLYAGKHLGFNGYVDNADLSNWTIAPVEGQEGVFTLATTDGKVLFWDGGNATTTTVGAMPESAANAYWKFISPEERLATFATATAQDPVDATFLISNPNFSREASSAAWNMVASNKNLCGGTNENKCAESYHSTFTLSQTLANAPKGVYALTAQGFFSPADAEGNKPVFYANEETVTFPAKTGNEGSMDNASVSFLNGLYVCDPVFVKVTEDGALTIGAKLEENTSLWCIWDNFQLSYYGENTDIEEAKNAAIIKELAELREKATELKDQVEVVAVKNAIDEALAATAEVTDAEAIKAAIETLKAVIEKANVHIAAKPALDGMENVMAGTNVYTAEAFETYNGIYVAAKAKYDAGELTAEDKIENPEALMGWHAANIVDDLLLSAWTIGETQCKDYDAGMYINTWSVEGESDGSNFKVPFFEYWVADANSLAENTLTATMSNVPEGDYNITAWVRVRAKNGYTAPAYGIALSANEGEAVDVAAGDQIGESQFYMKEFTAVGTVAEDGVLKIQFKVAADNNISWLSFKNVKFEKKPVVNDDDPEITVPEGKVNLIANGNLATDDVTSFVAKEAPSADIVGATIVPGAGKNNSRGIVVKSADDPAQAWDTQFWISLNEELPVGAKLHVEFDYAANKAAKASTQTHAAPGSYKGGFKGDINFTTEWQKYSVDYDVTAAGIQSIALNLAEEKTATEYYFDNFGVWYEAPIPVEEWTDLIVNGNMEGESMECFYVTEQGVGGPFVATATEGIGKDGSKAVKVQSADSPANDWATQFFIRLPYQLPAGTKYKVSFDYKADKAGDFDTQAHAEPGQYIHWAFCGSGSFTSDWQTYTAEGSVPAECDGSQGDGFLKIFQSIAFNLAKNKVATEFIFDNVKFEVPADIVSTLTKNPAVDPQPYPVGIQTVKSVKNVEGMYNLNGQKVNKAQKGLYIMNGKKVVVK